MQRGHGEVVGDSPKVRSPAVDLIAVQESCLCYCFLELHKVQLPAQARSSAAQQFKQRYAFGLIGASHRYRCLPMPGTGWTH